MNVCNHIVGHCYKAQANMNKFYIISVEPYGSFYVVCVRFGRVGGHYQYINKGSFDDYNDALVEQEKIWFSKEKTGYIDIDSSVYIDNVDKSVMITRATPCIRNALGVFDCKKIHYDKNVEEEIITHEDLKTCICGELLPPDYVDPYYDYQYVCEKCTGGNSIETKVKKECNKEWEVICISNVGMAEYFDVGVEYLAFEGELEKEDMICVWDKCGKKRECFISRFKNILY